ncbi:MAG: hypothetical protein WCW53_02155 [Syntrophales bacterium]|jgi:hypothetical protein|nr:hypothetical protein [Syntrophales bacterium]
MRFINLDGRQPKKAWIRNADRLLQKLNDAADESARKKIIKDNEGVWKQLLPWLRSITKGKCWFSEARGACQYWEVEHFRPKGAAKNIDGTKRPDGYWWLAFEWQNFRLSGGVTNRKKGYYFPLRPGTHFATSGNRNIDDEDPYLLDPTKQEDPPLLIFNRNGDVNPTPGTSSWDTERARVSIIRYKFQKHEEFVEARREIWAKCELEINKCRNFLRQQDSNPSATNRQKIRDQINKLREMGDFFSEFSAVANDCLRSCPDPFFQKLAGRA